MADDPRHITEGFEIPSEGYCDQPYVVTTDDGAWLCVMTTGPGHEGQAGQHVVSTRSTDQGRTWSPLADLEPSDGPEASYAVPLKAPGGRVYAFYNYNADNRRWVKGDPDVFPDGRCTRVDSQGQFVFRYSDDHGRSWSAKRYPIPVRAFDIDRENPYGGEVRFFWNVGKAFLHDGAAYCPLHKVGGFGEGFFVRNEGVLLRSGNLPHETDPAKITWETLPEGDVGLRTPPGGGPIASEHSFTVLSDGGLCAVYRSIDGYPVESYSRDGGHTWSTPRYRCFADGRTMKHPRAANFHWRCSNGKYLYWFHNHGGGFVRTAGGPAAYNDRNPVWLCGGVEADTPDGKVIRWSQPEIALYDDDPYVRMSYPDLVEADGRYFLIETQKSVARVHELPAAIPESLWAQFDPPSVARDGLLLELAGDVPSEADAPDLPAFTARDASRSDLGGRNLRTGFTIELRIDPAEAAAGEPLLDTRTPDGAGLCLRAVDAGRVEIVLNDGRTESRWASDPGTLAPGQAHHVTAIVDAGPRIVSFVTDGRFNDGCEFRQFGWGRFSPHLRDVVGSDKMRLSPAVLALRIYGRAIRVGEAVNNFRAGS